MISPNPPDDDNNEMSSGLKLIRDSLCILDFFQKIETGEDFRGLLEIVSLVKIKRKTNL